MDASGIKGSNQFQHLQLFKFSTTMIPLLVLLCTSAIFASEQKPKVIIIGSGPSGIAAATKLLQNGITDIKILEAENRIGGRVNSTKFGEYMIDLGAQWVHGDKDNVAYDLAWPLGLLSKAEGPGKPDMTPFTVQFYTSSGIHLSREDSRNLFEYVEENSEDVANLEGLKTGSIGEMMTKKLNDYFDANKDLDPNLREPVIQGVELMMMALDGAADWNDVSANGSMMYSGAGGFQNNNWKERSYSTILDIMMKKIPSSEEELPIMDKVLLNKKVTKIKYDGDGAVRVTTADGDEYEADHVICTVSIGVLKADHEKLFDPPLPEKNANSIKNLGFGRNAKIFLDYDEPWWGNEDVTVRAFLWTAADRKEIENDPERSWMLGISHAIKVEWKPKLLFLWMSGSYCEQMEKIPDDLFKNQTIGFIQKFFGNSFEVSQPKDIIRSRWNTNENFRGTYSYRSLASDANGASAADLGSPIMKNNKPVIQFAGEATESKNYATVHGAMLSGWREADRLIDMYTKEA